ncbi:unnamed protein product, partial [Amoebophrya sp. A120]|eukprot:GSA120T00009459001.1
MMVRGHAHATGAGTRVVTVLALAGACLFGPIFPVLAEPSPCQQTVAWHLQYNNHPPTRMLEEVAAQESPQCKEYKYRQITKGAEDKEVKRDTPVPSMPPRFFGVPNSHGGWFHKTTSPARGVEIPGRTPPNGEPGALGKNDFGHLQFAFCSSTDDAKPCNQDATGARSSGTDTPLHQVAAAIFREVHRDRDPMEQRSHNYQHRRVAVWTKSSPKTAASGLRTAVAGAVKGETHKELEIPSLKPFTSQLCSGRLNWTQLAASDRTYQRRLVFKRHADAIRFYTELQLFQLFTDFRISPQAAEMAGLLTQLPPSEIGQFSEKCKKLTEVFEGVRAQVEYDVVTLEQDPILNQKGAPHRRDPQRQHEPAGVPQVLAAIGENLEEELRAFAAADKSTRSEVRRPKNHDIFATLQRAAHELFGEQTRSATSPSAGGAAAPAAATGGLPAGEAAAATFSKSHQGKIAERRAKSQERDRVRAARERGSAMREKIAELLFGASDRLQISLLDMWPSDEEMKEVLASVTDKKSFIKGYLKGWEHA